MKFWKIGKDGGLIEIASISATALFLPKIIIEGELVRISSVSSLLYQLFFCCPSNYAVCCWNMSTWTKIYELVLPQKELISNFHVTRDFLFTLEVPGAVRAWDVHTGQRKGELSDYSKVAVWLGGSKDVLAVADRKVRTLLTVSNVFCSL